MRRPHRGKGHGHHKTHHRHVPVKKRQKHFKGVDNTKDIDLILSKGKLFQDLLGFSGEHLGRLFENAIEMLRQHRFDEAVLAFDLLTQLNPYISDFWLGLGLAHQAHEDYLHALSAFLVAQTMDPSRVDSYTYAITCCLEMKNYPQAEAIIQEAFTYAKKHPRNENSASMLKEMHSFQNRIAQEKKSHH